MLLSAPAQPPGPQAPGEPVPGRNTRKIIIIAVPVILLLSAAAVGAFVYTSGTASTTPSDCNPYTPLQLTSAKEETISQGLALSTPALALTWSNCVGESYQFTINSTAMLLTISASGTSSQVTGYLETAYALSSAGGVFSVAAHGSLTIKVAIETLSSFSADAQIQRVTGDAWAIDSSTGALISANDTVST